MFLEIIIWLLVAVLPPFILLHLTIVPKKSVKVSESSHPLHSGIYRAIHSKDALLSTPLNGSTTMYEVMAAAAAKFKDRKLFGYRELIRIVTEEKMVSKIVDGVEEKVAKKWNYFELSEYQWMTYSQVYDSISMIGAGLHALGLSSKEKLTLFAPTNQYWMMVAHGAFTQNITITTAYDTLGVDGLSFSLNEGNVCSLFTSIELLNLVPDISVLSKTLKTVIYAGIMF